MIKRPNNEKNESQNQVTFQLNYVSSHLPGRRYQPIFISLIGIFLIILPIILSIYTWRFHFFETSLAFLFGIFFLLIGVTTYPLRKCNINVFNDYFTFNVKTWSPFYNPIKRLNYSDIDGTDYNKEAKDLKIQNKNIKRCVIPLNGAKNKDVEKLINLLKSKNIKFTES